MAELRMGLEPGDIVSVLARAKYSEAEARMLADDQGIADQWATMRLEAKVVARSEAGSWKVQFEPAGDSDEGEVSVWRRRDLLFISRDGKTADDMEDAVRQAVQAARAGTRANAAREAAPAPEPEDDASVESQTDAAERMAEPQQEEPLQDALVDGWKRHDNANISQRAKDGVDHEYLPFLAGINDVKSISLFNLGVHFLPAGYMGELAARMQER